jgi:peptidoglycan hydrolase-like protein with peptidoglycan-binding domain
MRRARIAAGAAAAAALAGGGALVAARDGDGGGATARADAQALPAGTTTTAVRHGTLTARETADGTLGYADSSAVTAGAAGTVTRAPVEGSVLREGRSLLEVDGRRTLYLLGGRRPAWRDLTPGMSDGEDVRQLERALRRLGDDPDHAMTVDDEWTAATTAAVERFQKQRGLTQDGSLSRSEFVFWPARSARVGAVKAGRGTALRPGAPIATLSSRRREVTVDLDAERQSVAVAGERVIVTLPDGSTVGGTVTTVGKVATQGQDGATIPIAIRLRGARARGLGLDQAPVQVSFVRERAKDVDHVPVTALLARPGGGYAVQVAAGGGTVTTVAVTVGLVASGEAEVHGAGLHAGQQVVVPE